MAVTKRRRSDADSKKKDSPLSREDGTKAPGKSILESSEVSFPRGGASALTPLELKEVANEAARDVLFERENATSAQADDSRPLKKKKKTAKHVKATESSDQEIIPIEYLSFKNLIPDTLVLGQVSEINRLDIALSLPDNLVGYVPITSISSQITKQLEDFDESEDEDEEEEEGITVGTTKQKKFPELSKLFHKGQWLRAIVVESTPLEGKKQKQKKRIQLSIESEKVNKNLDEADDLIQNATLQATVSSVEDHGLILDIGKEGLTGFVSNKEIKAASLEPESILPGSVLLTTIASRKGRTVTVKLTTNKKSSVNTVSSIDSIVPGNLVETLITEVQQAGVVGKVLGLVNASINLSHLASFNQEDINHKFGVGSKINTRVVAVLISGGAKKLFISVLPHILSLNELPYDPKTQSAPLDAFPIGHTFDSVEVKGHDSNYIYVSVGNNRFGQVHMSRIDGDKSALATTYATGTKHSARVLTYSPIDNYFILTLDPKVIVQKYLRPQDIPIGELVTGVVLSVSSEAGLKVKIFEKFEAVASPTHLSDVKLIYPERKFKIGSKVKARILNFSKFKNEISLTLRKSLVGAENIITSIENAKAGERTVATVTSFNPSGAIVSFFGNLKAFLPKSEISETFVKKPEDHLRLGQTVTVRIVSVDEGAKRIQVSCRLSGESTEAQKTALNALVTGRSVVKAQIVEKTKDSVVVELPGSLLRGVIFDGHLSDGNYEQNRGILKRLEIGSTVEGVVLDKDSRTRIFNLSLKKSLIESALEEKLPTKYKDISISNELIPGYIKSITDRGLFVGFGAKLVGLVLAKYATERPVDDLNSVFHVNQSISVRVLRTDEENKRFLLTLKEKTFSFDDAVNPVDSTIKTVSELVPGKVTKAIVRSVKQTQLNVQLADNVQGRVDVSQIFENFEQIEDPKNPLVSYKKGDVLDVKVIGFHDAKYHRFLPITHRTSKQVIIELCAKKSDLEDSKAPEALSYRDITVGSEWVAFINNVTRAYFFVNLSPTIKGSISFMDLSDDASLLSNLEENFPLGSALKVKVKAVDTENNTVTLTARDDQISKFQDVKVGAKLPARVLKIADGFVLVELAPGISAICFITDALNDYTQKLNEVYSRNDIVSATVVSIDDANQKVNVILRSDEEAKDKLITKSSDVKRGDVVRGFVTNITDKGLFVSLGRTVTGYVRVTDLSDSFIKEWKKYYKPYQQVIGKVLASEANGNVTLTLKESEVNGKSNILKRFEDLKVGDIFEGSVRRVTDFGVFVKLDGTLNISGLAHQSQISDNPIQNLNALFGEGDRVKVKLLSLNAEKKQMSLGMKASFFGDDEEDAQMADADEDAESHDEEEEESDNDEEVEEADSGDEQLAEGAFENAQESEESDSDSEEEDEAPEESTGLSGLGTNGFDWTASILDQVQENESSDEEDFTQVRNKKKKKSKQIVEDTTGDIKSKAPQSVADFERLIIGNPNSSIVWMNYMSFQLQLSEIEKAREIGERALKTINYREEQEKLNIWIALLNLENTFGTSETLEDVFKRSCEYMDSLTMHQKLVSIYILSEKFSKAESLFKTITKKFGKTSVAVWVTFGSYLFDRQQSEKAREVLGNALQSLPKRDHIEVVRKFAQLEFAKGDAEQGRTLFEGLIADVPKRIDLWNVYIDQEVKQDEKKKVEELFERVLTRKMSRKQAKFFFAKWLNFEDKKGDEKGADYVKAKAQEYVQNQ